MTKKLALGDKVRIYDAARGFNGTPCIVTGWDDAWVKVSIMLNDAPSAFEYLVHPKQCRSPKPKTRELWVNHYGEESFITYKTEEAAWLQKLPGSVIVHYREVPNKEVIK